MSSARKVLGGVAALLVAVVVVLAVSLRPRPLIDYTPHEPPTVADAFAFRDDHIAASKARGVPDRNTERLVLHRSGGSDVVFLYLHGFSASRGEGEYLVDTLAAEWSANSWYVLLPGHGGPGEALAQVTPAEYFDTVTDAVGMANRLGDKVVVVATSTGAMLGVWAAATFPEHIDALIIASPLFGYADPKGTYLLGSANAEWFVHQVLGEVRDLRPMDARGERYTEPEARWTSVYPSKSLVVLDDVRAYGARPEVHDSLEQPILMFYYYADEQHQDNTINIDDVKSAYARFNHGTPHPHSKLVPIAEGEHVLFSQYKESDKDTILAESRDFLRQVVGSPPRERALEAASSAEGLPPG